MPASGGEDTRVLGSLSIRKRGDCPREQVAGNGGGNRRQDGNKAARRQFVFCIGMGNGEPNAL